MKQQYQLRSLALAVIIAIFGVGILVQMVRIQRSPQAEAFRQLNSMYQGNYRTIFPPRGEIYDRNGHLLAGNETVYEVGVNLHEVRNAATIAGTLSSALALDYDQVYSAINGAPQDKSYAFISDFASPEKVAELQALQKQFAEQPDSSTDSPSLAGLAFIPHLARSYPEDSLASNVLGFVTHEGRGYFGVEEKYNDLLAGQPKMVWVPEDPNLAEQMPQVPAGTDLILTIDREMQAATEQILDNALAETGADNGTIIVMDPRTGDILGMAGSPRLNLNEFWNYKSTFTDGANFNRAISAQYEPGSVFKILTMSAAIDSATVSPSTTFFDQGSYEMGGAYISNWDGGAWGQQDMIGCLQHSLNVCLSWVADQMGPDTFYTALQKFGIGRPTGVDLTGEATGRLKLPGDSDWYLVDLATNSFGQGVAITPIQMVMAASALANDGKMVVPHVLYGMVTNGRQYNTPTQIAGTPITAQTARTVTEMLAQSLERGEGTVDMPDYRVAGKTGTAQIPGANGVYLNDATNASFVGWGPADDPQVLIYVWLERPEVSEWASIVAAPVFQEVFEKAAVLLGIPPDSVRRSLAGQ
jgi:cell division protein FtsI/penicillin-binding protein 2